MTIATSGPWQQAQIAEFLDTATLPIRLSCVAADGFPRVISLWFLHRAGNLYCVTHRSSKLVSLLNHSDKIGFEVAPDAPPYHGVRGQGRATLTPLGEDPALELLLQRYMGDLNTDFSQWLLSRKEEELIVCIKPHRLFSWDYRERMASVV